MDPSPKNVPVFSQHALINGRVMCCDTKLRAPPQWFYWAARPGHSRCWPARCWSWWRGCSPQTHGAQPFTATTSEKSYKDAKGQSDIEIGSREEGYQLTTQFKSYRIFQAVNMQDKVIILEKMYCIAGRKIFFCTL